MPCAAVAGLVSAGVGAAAASGAFAPDAPDAPNYGQITRDAQEAEIELTPRRLEARRQYDPQSAALDVQLARQSLFGSPASQRQEAYTVYDEVPGIEQAFAAGAEIPVGYTFSRSSGGGGGGGGIRYYRGPSQYVPRTETRTIHTPASLGLFDVAEEAAPRQNALEAAQRRNQAATRMGLLEEFGGRAFRSIRDYDPQSRDAADLIYRNAMERAGNPDALSPYERRGFQQDIRAAQGARGVGYGSNDAAAEAFYLADRRRTRQLENEAQLAGVIDQRAALYGDPYRAILQETPVRSTNPAQFVNPYASAVNQPNSGAYGLAAQGYAAQNAAQTAGYNSRMAGLGALTGNAQGLGTLGTALGNWYNTGVFSAAPRGSLGGY